MVVLGGPGTGKTARILAAAEEAQAAGRRALLVATSPAVATTLRGRVGHGGRPAEAAPRILTIPALALTVLRDVTPPGARPPRLIGRSERVAMLHEFVATREVAAGAPTPADLLERIDRLAAHGIDATRIASWAAALADGPFAARQREFADLALRHDEMLAARGLRSSAAAVLDAVRELQAGGSPQSVDLIAVDDAQHLAPAELELVLACAAATEAELLIAADDDQADRAGESAAAAIRGVLQRVPAAQVTHLETSQRLTATVARAAELVVGPAGGRLRRPPLAAPQGGAVELHRHAGGQEQASRIAAWIAGSISAGTRPDRIAIACVDPSRDARALALALEARGVACDAVDLESDADRPELRDLLAWIRLLLDGADAAAAVRALTRPPIGLPGADLARIVQVSRRKHVALADAARIALDGPGLEPRSRERAQEFLAMLDRHAPRMDDGDALALLRDLVAALGLHRRQLAGAGPDVRAVQRALRRVEAVAAGHVARRPDASAREVFAGVAELLDAGVLPREAGEAPSAPGPSVQIVGVRVEELHGVDVDELHLVGLDQPAVEALGEAAPEPLLGEEPGEPLDRARRLLYLAMTRARERLVLSVAGTDPAPLLDELAEGLGTTVESERSPVREEEQLLEAAGALRDLLSHDIARAAAGIDDLRLDGDLELTHAVARVLELIKVAALLGRDPQSSPLSEAIDSVNHQLRAAASPAQREVLDTSDLDARLIAGERITAEPPPEPSLAAFLPRRGEGIALSATDISTYLACPLQYKYGRVLKVPRPQTVQQRFGIAVHQAIERYHAAGGGPLPKLLGLLDGAWRSGGLGYDDASLTFRGRAERALREYHARLALDPGEPVWVERPFEFRIGRHALRGRVDRVDRLPDGGYELIDVKTGPPREPGELQRDVQLALYDLAAREAWRIEPSLRSYYYVLDDRKVQLPAGVDADWVTQTVDEVGAGIEAEQFAPTPSDRACGWCDFRLACPAAER